MGDPAAVTEIDRLVRRLRRLSAREWAASGRADVVRDLARSLAAIGAPGHAVPDDLPVHALADVIAVLGADALATPVAEDDVVRLVRAAWAATR